MLPGAPIATGSTALPLKAGGAPEDAPRTALRASRAFRWAVLGGAAVMVAIAIVLLFLLTQATNNRELYERNYGRLFILNMVVAAVLTIWSMAYYLRKAIPEIRAKAK